MNTGPSVVSVVTTNNPGPPGKRTPVFQSVSGHYSDCTNPAHSFVSCGLWGVSGRLGQHCAFEMPWYRSCFEVRIPCVINTAQWKLAKQWRSFGWALDLMESCDKYAARWLHYGALPYNGSVPMCSLYVQVHLCHYVCDKSQVNFS